MRTVAHDPESPVAIPAKDSVTVREPEPLDLVVDLAPRRLAVLGAASVDVVEGEEHPLALVAAGADSAVGVEHLVSQLSGPALGVGADVLAVGVAPFGMFVAELLSVGLASLGVSLAAAGAADISPAGGAPVDDELVSGSSLTAPLTGPFVH